MLLDIGDMAALDLALAPPATEVAIEARLIFAPIIVVVAVECFHLAVAPGAIMRIAEPLATAPVTPAAPVIAPIAVAIAAEIGVVGIKSALALAPAILAAEAGLAEAAIAAVAML